MITRYLIGTILRSKLSKNDWQIIDSNYPYQTIKCLESFNKQTWKVGDFSVNRNSDEYWNIVYHGSGRTIIKKDYNKRIMSYIQTVSIKLRAALGDVKANQIVANLRNTDLSLTSEGKEVVLNAIADGESAPEALTTEANRIIEESKKKD